MILLPINIVQVCHQQKRRFLPEEIAKQFPPEETVVFVDDTIEQCLSVKESLPNSICCLIVRNKSLIDDIEITQDIRVVQCLADVDDIIESI